MKIRWLYPIFIMAASCYTGESHAQIKKSPVKKATVTTKPKTPLKTNTPLKTTSSLKTNNLAAKTKLPVKNKPVLAVKKTLPAYKDPNKNVVTPVIPNKPVNNSDITNAGLTSREQEMINEINNLRSNPGRYCVYVENYLQKYDADAEMKDAAKELVAVLKKMKPLNSLVINPVMYNDAKQYGLIMAKKNIFEHSSLPYYENLSLGHRDIREAIVDLLIDDGIPTRGHRNNLLNEKIMSVAVYELPGKVQNIGYCYVQEFK